MKAEVRSILFNLFKHEWWIIMITMWLCISLYTEARTRTRRQKSKLKLSERTSLLTFHYGSGLSKNSIEQAFRRFASFCSRRCRLLRSASRMRRAANWPCGISERLMRLRGLEAPPDRGELWLWWFLVHEHLVCPAQSVQFLQAAFDETWWEKEGRYIE